MRKILLGGVALTALAAAFPSFAADLPPNSAPPNSYYSSTPVFNWTGLYAGVNGGYGSGSFLGGGTTRFGGADAGVLGATAGYNYQVNQFVVGVESDLDWTSFESSKTYLPGPISENAKLDDLWTMRGRVGYAMDNVLLFATGGYAGGMIRTSLTDSTSPVPLGGPTYRSDYYSNGFAIGGGLEYALSSAISIKAEYLYTSLDRQTIFGGAHLTTAALNESLVRGGVDFHF
jgi:outer membrane immunogenic protein